jgi:mRNA interferase MazF
VTRGEIRWYTFHLPDKRRPVLVLTRDEVIDRLNEIIVVPVTRTIRGLRTEILLTEEDGMPAACAANFDHLAWSAESVRLRALYPVRPALARGPHRVVGGVQLRSRVKMPGNLRCKKFRPRSARIVGHSYSAARNRLPSLCNPLWQCELVAFSASTVRLVDR